MTRLAINHQLAVVRGHAAIAAAGDMAMVGTHQRLCRMGALREVARALGQGTA